METPMLVALIAAAVAAPGLDAPVTPTHPTVRSEIRRGVDAAFDCQRFGSFAEMELYQRCIQASESRNRQVMGSAFQAFDVGLYRVARDHMANAVQVLAGQPAASFDPELVKAGLEVEEAGYQQSRKALGLSEEQVEAVVHPRR
jgi:hypothetical protein